MPVLGLELRASYLLCRRFITWVPPSDLFALVILEIGSYFVHRSAWTAGTGMTDMHHHVEVFFFFSPIEIESHKYFCSGCPGTTSLVRMTGTHYCAYLLVEMGVLQTICPGWHQTVSLPTSASQVTKITSMSHQCLALSVCWMSKWIILRKSIHQLIIVKYVLESKRVSLLWFF
jgi:hypothetical protein